MKTLLKSNTNSKNVLTFKMNQSVRNKVVALPILFETDQFEQYTTVPVRTTILTSVIYISSMIFLIFMENYYVNSSQREEAVNYILAVVFTMRIIRSELTKMLQLHHDPD